MVELTESRKSDFQPRTSPVGSLTADWEPRDAGLLWRETKGEVVSVSRLRAAMDRLIPSLPPKAINAPVDELTRDRSAISLEAANSEAYRFLKEEIPISVLERDSTSGSAKLSLQKSFRRSSTAGLPKVRTDHYPGAVISWEQPANHDFLLVSQFMSAGCQNQPVFEVKSSMPLSIPQVSVERMNHLFVISCEAIKESVLKS